MDSEIRCLTATTRRATIARGGRLAAVLGLFATGVWGQATEAKKKKKKKKKKTINLSASPMSGANEVPGPGAGDPNGFGAASFTIKGSQICGTFNLTTNPASTVVGTHIHQAAVGVDGPIVVSFTPPTIDQKICVTCPSSACSDSTILSQITSNPGGFYANIHTQAFPDGAVRAQLVKV